MCLALLTGKVFGFTQAEEHIFFFSFKTHFCLHCPAHFSLSQTAPRGFSRSFSFLQLADKPRTLPVSFSLRYFLLLLLLSTAKKMIALPITSIQIFFYSIILLPSLPSVVPAGFFARLSSPKLVLFSK